MRISGTYALVLYLPHAQTIRIGKLGAFEFPRGYYIYVGSALNGLAARIARHLRPNKKRFWHIDYFLEHARIKQVWTHQGDERLECVWARAALVLPHARIIAPRFGASDCNCPAHLIYLRNVTAVSRRSRVMQSPLPCPCSFVFRSPSFVVSNLRN